MTPDDLAHIEAWAVSQLTARTPPRERRAQTLRIDLVAELRRARRLEVPRLELHTAYERWRSSGTATTFAEWCAERVQA